MPAATHPADRWPDDPPPREPDKPLPSDCCESGCPICVFDLYAEELAAYREKLAAWKQRHPEAE
ncbi:hypothetical protein GCM10027084_28030 [Pseudoxanthomonas sangjuensis]|uniref:oxidoreductase-like domain-containing protein n=1 Tax=Pseudoxanthomonas sangjuensis TaxID=1503750 RepID=UPI001391BE47|nr:oxidoreductase-like domain-containing protein [Pseudoxanthomonas sangjuensis]KAF1713726.1 oxidoreductase-like protein [Pseudoxanthomonas sangjuensis]